MKFTCGDKILKRENFLFLQASRQQMTNFGFQGISEIKGNEYKMELSPRNQLNMVPNSTKRHERWLGDDFLYLLLLGWYLAS
jgi:hypothetical protein